MGEKYFGTDSFDSEYFNGRDEKASLKEGHSGKHVVSQCERDMSKERVKVVRNNDA